jgi:hypothetical protein
MQLMDFFMDDTGILLKFGQWGWTAMALALGFFLKSFHSEIKQKHRDFDAEFQRVKDDHAEHRLHVAQNYLTNARADRMEEKIDKIYEAVVKK